jgi:hypothetical protein
MNLLRSILSNNTTDSSKRWITFGIAVVMCTSVASVTFAIAYQALKHWSVDGALVTAYTIATGIVAALAQQIYRKPESGDPPASSTQIIGNVDTLKQDGPK